MCNSGGRPRVNLVEQILEQGQRLRNAMVESILTHDPLYNHFTTRPTLNTKMHAISTGEEKNNLIMNSADHELTARKCLEERELTAHKCLEQPTTTKCLEERELTTPEKHQFLAYLHGDEMSTRDEKQALETFRAMSNTDICEITQRSFTTLQNKCDCDTCKAYKNLNLKFDVPPLDLKSNRMDSKSSYNEGFLKYVDTLKIAVHSLRLNHEGDVKVSSSFNKNQKNVRMSESLAVTYFIEYDVPSVVIKSVPKKAKVDTGLGSSNVVKLCSKKLHNEAIYFKQISIHDVANLDRFDLNDIDIKFTVSCRSVRQKGVSVIGYAKFNMGSFFDAENLSCNQELVVVLKESTPVVLGRIKIGLQLGAGRLYYGKEFLDSFRNSKETNTILPEIVSCDVDDIARNPVNGVSKEEDKKDFNTINNTKINKAMANICKGKNKVQEKHNLKETAVQAEDPKLQISNRTILFGFIYVSEVEYLDTKECTYFTCQPFCQSDLINSSPVNGGSNPIFNFQQKIPIIYEEPFISKLRDNFMVFEFWEKHGYKDELIGVCSIPLHQYYLAFRNPVIVDYLNRNKLPVIGTDWYEPISHPTSGTISGQVLILIALGSESQINNLEKERGFKDNIVTRAKRILVTKRPLVNEPQQIPERERVTFKSLRQKLNSAKEILEKNNYLDETYTSDYAENIYGDKVGLVDNRSTKQGDWVRLLHDSNKKQSDKVRLVEDNSNSSEWKRFYDRRKINSDNFRIVNDKGNYDESERKKIDERDATYNKKVVIFDDREKTCNTKDSLVEDSAETYKKQVANLNREKTHSDKVRLVEDQQSNHSGNIKILDDRLIASEKVRLLKNNKKTQSDSFRSVIDKSDKVRLVNDKSNKVRLVNGIEELDVNLFGTLKDRRKIESDEVRLAQNKENIPGQRIRRVFFEDGEVFDKNDDYYDSLKNCDKIKSPCLRFLTEDEVFLLTENSHDFKSCQDNLDDFNKRTALGFKETIVDDFDKTIGDFNCEVDLIDRNISADFISGTKYAQTEPNIEIEYSKEPVKPFRADLTSCNSRQSNPEFNFIDPINVSVVTKCDKSTQKSDTLDKAVQYEEIMEDKKGDPLETLLQQLITARQSNIASNIKPAVETKIDNANSVKTPLTINTNCNATTTPPANANLNAHEVRKTVDLLDTLNQALSIDCTPQFNENFKAHVVVESALHLPTRVKCKARKGKGGRSSTEKILPSTYVTFETDKDDIRATHVVQRSSSPKWDYRCDITLPSDLLVNNQKRLIFKVWKKPNNSSVQPNMQIDSVLGFAAVDLTVLLAGLPTVQGWFNIIDFSSKCNGQIKISVAPLENISRFNLHKNNSNRTPKNPEPPAIKTNESQDEPGELLSRALKRKFTELDEITQRLRSRLSNVTNEESDTSNDDVADEFEKDINTLCVEDDFDMLNFVREAQTMNMQKVSDSLLKWQGVAEQDNQTLMVFSEDTSVASCSKTIESTDCAHLDRQLAEGKNRIDTLLQKLSLIPKNNERQNLFTNENEGECFSNQTLIPAESEVSNQKLESGGFSSRYVSGCSDVSRVTTLRTNEEILLELGVKDDDFDPSRLLDADLLMEGLKSSSESSVRDAPDGEGEKRGGN